METPEKLTPTLLQSAAEHLQQAEKNFEVAKAQFESAKAVLQSARLLHQSAENSQNAFTNSRVPSRLCQSCLSIPVASIFKTHLPSKVPRYKIGDLFQVVENQSSCVFCKFLLEAFQLGDPEQSERLHAQLTPRDTAVYLAQDPEGQPWFQKAGISADMKPAPFTWLQTGPKTQTGQPHLCITFEPVAGTDEEILPPGNLVFPRRRNALEAFNGSIDYELVLSWLRKCESGHSSCCPDKPTSETSATAIFLIDVHNREIVRGDTNTRYVALSYVWGMGPFDSTTYLSSSKPAATSTSSGSAKQKPHPDIPNNIPQTIEDALTFVERIGEQFLWVDLFCIDQTNDDERHAQINAMDRIYSSAFLTLIALDGETADWGLPGVSRSLLQTNQPTVLLGQGRLTATYIYSVWDNNGKSVSDRRAWTLQERLLLNRCMIFAASSISMQCRTEFFHDSMPLHLESTGVKTWLGDDYFREDGSGINLDQAEWDFKTWDALVSVYSGRKLTYQSDALNACQGSLNRISLKTGFKFCFGLPKQDFLRALLWKPHHEHVLVRRPEFPSWSWLGWAGRAECAYWIGDMADYANDEDDDDHAERSKKRRRLLFERSGPEAAEIVLYPNESSKLPYLFLDTPIARHHLKLRRKHGTKLKHLSSRSLQPKVAVGDHWTINTGGTSLRDQAGELPSFESCDYFFRTDETSSGVLHKNDLQVDLIFVHYWPQIRDSSSDSGSECQWLYNMVSALVAVQAKDGAHSRLGSVLLEAETWYSQQPEMKRVRLV